MSSRLDEILDDLKAYFGLTPASTTPDVVIHDPRTFKNPKGQRRLADVRLGRADPGIRSQVFARFLEKQGAIVPLELARRRRGIQVVGSDIPTRYADLLAIMRAVEGEGRLP